MIGFQGSKVQSIRLFREEPWNGLHMCLGVDFAPKQFTMGQPAHVELNVDIWI